MDRRANRALLTIRACVGAGRYGVLRHFTERMDQRGLVWADVLAALDVDERGRVTVFITLY